MPVCMKRKKKYSAADSTAMPIDCSGTRLPSLVELRKLGRTSVTSDSAAIIAM